MNGAKLFLEQTITLQAQKREIVEAGVWWGMRNGIRFDVGVDGGDDLIGFGDLKEGVVEPDLDAGEVEGIIAQFDGLTTKVGGDAVAVFAKGKGSGLGNLAVITVKESLAEFCWVDGADGRVGVLTEAFEGGLTGLGVEFAVVHDLDPG